MRTKQTGKAVPKVRHGKTHATSKHKHKHKKAAEAAGPPPPPTSQKAPRAAGAPDAERHHLREWLDRSETPFVVVTSTSSRKRKRDEEMQVQLFEQERLNVLFEVQPRAKWDPLKNYKKVTIETECFAVGQCVMVRTEQAEGPHIDFAKQWKARVLEVKAFDKDHVYIRVAWLYRPEDLPGGRQAHHGTNELIPSNHMDVIPATSVNGAIDVVHWDDGDDDSASIGDQYFWRQTYDCTSKKFSVLRPICVENVPSNPEQLILQCSNPECGKWLHVSCLAKKAVKDFNQVEANDDDDDDATKTPPKTPPTLDNGEASARYEDTKTKTTATVFIKGLPEGEVGKTATATEVVITGPDGQQQLVDFKCLLCHQVIQVD